jgi:hypothetical protein
MDVHVLVGIPMRCLSHAAGILGIFALTATKKRLFISLEGWNLRSCRSRVPSLSFSYHNGSVLRLAVGELERAIATVPC